MASTIRTRIRLVNTHLHRQAMNNGPMKFREWLKQEMRQKKMSQNELARLSKVPQPTIHRILSGETPDPRGSTMAKIENVLGRQQETIKPDPGTDAAVHRFAMVYRNASDMGRLFLDNAIDTTESALMEKHKQGKKRA